jgi:Fur family transcriptional regulator, peroxide stress response regulator
MKFESEALQERLNHFKEGLRHSGVKLTHQRLEIFHEVAISGDHPDAETIFKGVRQRVPSVSLDTVYRTLWLLLDLGLVNTLGPPREKMRFDANMKSHHHFICMKCGMTRDFYSKEFDQLQIPEEVQTLGTVKLAQVEVRGICVRCSKQSNPKHIARRKKEKQ